MGWRVTHFDCVELSEDIIRTKSHKYYKLVQNHCNYDFRRKEFLIGTVLYDTKLVL